MLGSNTSVVSGVSGIVMHLSTTQRNRQRDIDYANVTLDNTLLQLVPQGTKRRDLMGNNLPLILIMW
jgi:hypothetical protein